MNQTAFEKKVRITGELVFETAFHIGSGKEGELATDMGVLKDAQNWPVLPGSTLKGNFRSTAENLACHLGLTACLLDKELSKIECVGDQTHFRKVNDEFKNITGEKEKLEWLSKKTCDVCQLFGSPLQASRIFFSDGELICWSGSYQVRDGVMIDRDSGTARPNLKYDFEVASPDTTFRVIIDLDNPHEKDLVLVSAVIAEWKYGFRIGGFTSRGLGRAVLNNSKVEEVDYSKPDHLKDFLLHRKMQPKNDLLDEKLNKALGGELC